MKKILSIIAVLLSAVIVFASLIITNVSAFDKGDVNEDGNINAVDVLFMSRYLVNNAPSNFRSKYADMNGDGVINAKDLLFLRAQIAGITINPSGTTVTTTTTKSGTTNPNLPLGVDPYYLDGLARVRTINECSFYTVAVNQLGYSPNGIKKIVLTEGRENAPSKDESLISGVECYIVDVNAKKSVASFTSTSRSTKFTKKLYDSEALFTSEVDISSFKTPGTYRLYTPMGYSCEFEIKDNPYNKLTDDLLMAFYYQRCGGELSEEVIQKYDDYLSQKYGTTAGSYFDTYKYHARTACHVKSSNRYKGQEVTVVDTFKYRTNLTFVTEASEKIPDVVSLAKGLNLMDDVYYYSSNSENFTEKDGSGNTVYKVKFYLSAVCDKHLNETQINQIKAAVAGKLSSGATLNLTTSRNGTFVANSKEGYADIDGKNGTVITYPASDFAYGLHDAGDYGRYTQPAAQTVCDLIYAYELMPDALTLDVVQDTNGKGEKDNLPDVLDHARWEAKFLLNMQSKTGSSTGGFYFKICTKEFASAQGVTPEGDNYFNGNRGSGPTATDYSGLRVMNVNFADTAYAVNALAACYSVFKDKDPEFADQCLTAAKKGFDYLSENYGKTNQEALTRDTAAATTQVSRWNTGGGAYGGTSAEAKNCMWGAAGSLYRATGDNTYLNYMLSGNGNVQTYPTDMGTHTGGGFGTLSLLLAAKDGMSVASNVIDSCNNVFKNAANSANSRSNEEIFHNIPDYGWGSNPRMVNAVKGNAVAYKLGIQTTANALNAVGMNLNYMTGTNPENWCFITGETEYSSKNIHHFPSIPLKNKYKDTKCVPGLLAGGYTDEGTGGFRYVDDQNDYVCNEICVYWNSSVVFAFAGVVDNDIALAKS